MVASSLRFLAFFVIALTGLALCAPLAADGGVTYQDIAADDGAGITYRRAPSASKALFDDLKAGGAFAFEQLPDVPMKARGAPGVALLDYDDDGDLDIYVTNGPGAANSLYSNQLTDTGETTFVDVAVAAGVDATAQDSTGVCFGDLDNDGDHDLLVLSHNAPHQLFENRGDGTFVDTSATSGLAATDVRSSSGCSMGDVDGDGLLDILIGNTFDNWDHFRGVNVEPFALNQHNQLFHNDGGLVFTDTSAAAGVESLAFPSAPAGAAGLTWAIALVDLDLDGDVDILAADDQGGIPDATSPTGVDRGLLHVLENDGTGVFTDVTLRADLAVAGAWMGLSFADFDCNGTLDFFASNFGDYVPFSVPDPGQRPSRWFLGRGDGTFADPGVGALVTTPFGWGTSTLDYDNDGDFDILSHGGLDVGPGIEASNGGVLLTNSVTSGGSKGGKDSGCTAAFSLDTAALAASTDHGRRTVHGVAVGDLDANGFADLVSVSNFDVPPGVELTPHSALGSPFDGRASFRSSFVTDPVSGERIWSDTEYADGTLAVELATDNGNGWVEIRVLGSAGLVDAGRVNRDGIGAVVRLWSETTPEPGLMKPVLGGSSYASQDALAVQFGLGASTTGHVEVLWPGGVKNRVYDVAAGERLVVPEVPCTFDDPEISYRAYLACLIRSFADLVATGTITHDERSRLFLSAIRARRDAVGGVCEIDGEIGDTLLAAQSPAPLKGFGGADITFTDIAADDGAGISYRRQPSESKAKFDAIKNDPPYSFDKRNDTPLKSWGAPGVALFDHDHDGDLDIYVTNGPGAANSLYSNQLAESGETRFVDVGADAGVGAVDHDSTGVCYGDLDNDGDHDLLVLSHNAPSRLFENQGNGTFTDISAVSGLAASPVRASSGCSLGDVDTDGLLDITIGNTYDNWNHSLGLNVERFALNEHNRLYLNRGGNVFEDMSAAAGIESLVGLPLDQFTAAGLTWATAMADYDLDGDIDIFYGDDQSGFPTASEGGVDRGLIHIFTNDGTGFFDDTSLVAFGETKPGAWMGITFGDFNCDGHLDFFGSNFGDYNPFVPQPPGRRPSRWFLGRGDGTFSDPGVGALVTTPFGWGVSAADYDNDGDLDVIYHGGIDVGPAMDLSNPGVILRNPECSAAFEADLTALAGSTDHIRRVVHGMAVGDLDGNGFVDIVSVSNFNLPESVRIDPHDPFGAPWDPRASFHLSFEPDPVTGELVWVGSVMEPGTLSVELSSGNGNGWVEVRPRGAAGLLPDGRVNRDGIGAVVGFKQRELPRPGTLLPIVGGSSYASQDELVARFGTGGVPRGIVDVYWPGGVRNRLYSVKPGERIVFPEIPCSYTDASTPLDDYLGCVLDAFDGLVEARALRPGQRVRFLLSALRARRAALGISCVGKARLEPNESGLDGAI